MRRHRHLCMRRYRGAAAGDRWQLNAPRIRAGRIARPHHTSFLFYLLAQGHVWQPGRLAGVGAGPAQGTERGLTMLGNC